MKVMSGPYENHLGGRMEVIHSIFFCHFGKKEMTLRISFAIQHEVSEKILAQGNLEVSNERHLSPKNPPKGSPRGPPVGSKWG